MYKNQMIDMLSREAQRFSELVFQGDAKHAAKLAQQLALTARKLEVLDELNIAASHTMVAEEATKFIELRREV